MGASDPVSTSSATRGFLARLLGRTAAEMTFLDHLEELRRVIISCLTAIAIGSCVAYFFSDRILDYIVVSQVGEAQFLHPMEAFSVRIKIAVLCGVIATIPFTMFEIWGFILPGLMGKERRIVLPMVVGSVLLFLGGMSFSYFVLTPMMLDLLMGFSNEHVKANITVSYLIDFVLKLAAASGLMFQLPLVVAVLTMLRMVTPRFLWSKWRHAIVIILVVSAVVTPGDGPSQIILAAPIIVLYFLSILVSLAIVRGRHDAPAVTSGEPEAGGVSGRTGEVGTSPEAVPGSTPPPSAGAVERPSGLSKGARPHLKDVLEPHIEDGPRAPDAPGDSPRDEGGRGGQT